MLFRFKLTIGIEGFRKAKAQDMCLQTYPVQSVPEAYFNVDIL